ncbi:MAG: 3-coathanger stack domain-containing protein, partial [Saprospiraceae bacterium]
DLSDHDFAFLEVDVLPIGEDTDLEAIVKFFFNECPLQLTLNNETDDFNSTVNRKAERIVAANAIGVNANVTYEAATEIHLQAGFSVAASAEFTATISDCENAMPTIHNDLVETRTDDPQNDFQPLHTTSFKFNVFPNPTTTDTQILIQLPSSTNLNISLFAQSGKLLQQLLPSQEKNAGAFHLNIPIAQLPIGMNYVVLQTEEERIVRKVIRVQ